MWEYELTEQTQDPVNASDARPESDDFDRDAEWIGEENGKLVTYRNVDGRYEKTGYLEETSVL